MLRAYLNYPNSRVRIHRDPDCPAIQQMGKPKQRCVFIDAAALPTELGHFIQADHQFASRAEVNDLWLDIDLGDSKFERALVDYIVGLLGKRYERFKDAAVRVHC